MSVVKHLGSLSLTRRNVLASFAGKMLTALLSLACTPLFSKLLGIEAYGLIGFSVTLNAALNLLDMGFSATMNREMAHLTVPIGDGNRASGGGSSVEIPAERALEARTLVRTLERVYWPICLLIALGIAVLAPVLTHRWVHVHRLHPITVQHAILLMGVSLALQWPFTLYEGGLMGLQRQVVLNSISVLVALLRNVVPLIFLRYTPSILTYFWWQLVVSGVMTGSVWWSLWRALPPSEKAACFDSAVLGRVWKFAAGMAGIATVNLLITQADKVVLSRELPTLGYYTLAIGAAGALYYLVAPLNNALFPRFVQMFAQKETQSLARLYHAGCQAMSVIILPVGLVMAAFAPEVMLVWTRDTNTAAHTARLLVWLAGGFVCNGIMTLPFSLQTAAGWTRLTLIVSTAWAALIVPLLLVMTRRFGPEGAAMVWFLMNFSHLFVIVPLVHRRLLKGELAHWYLRDLARPAFAASLVVLAFRLLPEPFIGSRIGTVLWLIVVWFCAVSAATLISPQARSLRKQRTAAGEKSL